VGIRTRACRGRRGARCSHPVPAINSLQRSCRSSALESWASLVPRGLVMFQSHLMVSWRLEIPAERGGRASRRQATAESNGLKGSAEKTRET
jgi:hypothetical protein